MGCLLLTRFGRNYNTVKYWLEQSEMRCGRAKSLITSSAFDMRLMQKVLVLSVPFVYIIKHVIFSVGFIWIVEEQSLCGSILNKTLSQLGHFSSADENEHRTFLVNYFGNVSA